MDSPLNLAHQQGRRADSLVKAGRYDEAITSHHRAAESLLEAMRLTTCKTALQSIQLQHAHHLKQADQLGDKQRRADLLQIRNNKSQNTLRSQTTQTDLQGPVIAASHLRDQTENLTFQLKAQGQVPGLPSGSSMDENDESVYRTLTENDSLIGLLIRRRQNPDGQDLNSFHSGVPVERVFYTNSDEDTKPAEINVTDELKCHNEDLRKHVQQLLREVDELKRDNRGMKMKLDQLERKQDTEGIFQDMGGSGIEMLPDLPPLEMPTFDMNLLLDHKSDESLPNISP